MAAQIAETDQLLNKYINVLSKSEEFSRLIFDEKWHGAEAVCMVHNITRNTVLTSLNTQDEQEFIRQNREEEERARRAAEEKARREHEEQERLEREQEERRRREEKERLEREKSERAIRGGVRGVRGTRASARGKGTTSRGGVSSL